jgi:hypothetical protein
MYFGLKDQERPGETTKTQRQKEEKEEKEEIKNSLCVFVSLWFS